MNENGDVVSNDPNIVNFWSNKKYKTINHHLGAGAFGKTLLVEDCDIGLQQVVKVYRPNVETVEQKKVFFELFKKEIKVLCKLNHPCIVRFFAAHVYDASLSGIIMMEYIKGKTLDLYFRDFNVIFDDCNAVFRQLIDAFAYLEQNGVMHRDIRPSNIMVDELGSVKVIDFGLVKEIRHKDSNANSLQSVINLNDVIQYPEEYKENVYTSRTDMYYLGEMLMRLMAKKEIQDAFFYQEIVEKMSQISPAGRYKSFGEILSVIDKGVYDQVAIPEQEKLVYREFAGAVEGAFVNRDVESKLNRLDESLVRQLDEVLKDNAYEDEIQDMDMFLHLFVFGGFRYYAKPSVSTECVRRFCTMYWGSSKNKRDLMARNFNARMKTIPVDRSDAMPF